MNEDDEIPRKRPVGRVEYADPRIHTSMTERFGNVLGWFTGSVGRGMLAWLFVASPILFVLDAGYDARGNVYVRPGARAALLYVLILMTVLSLLVLAKCMQANRRRRASAILAYVMQAVRLRIPMVPLLDAAMSAEGGRLGREIGRFRTLLEAGVTLADSLALATPAVDARTAALLAAAQHNGTLAETIERLAREARREPAGRIVDRAFRKSYVLVVAMVGAIVVAMVLIFVMPKFQQIFRDFGTELPAVTIALLSIAESTWMLAPLALLLPIVLLWMCGNALRDIATARPKRTPLRALRDRITWKLPVVGGVVRDRGLADVFRVLADGLAAGRPAGAAIEESAGRHLNHVLKTRVNEWAIAAQSGATLADAARGAGLPRLVAGMLATARSGEDVIEVCEFLHRHYAARFSRAAIVLDAAIGPLITLAMAAVVLFVLLALFSPLVSLIESIASAQTRVARY